MQASMKMKARFCTHFLPILTSILCLTTACEPSQVVQTVEMPVRPTQLPSATTTPAQEVTQIVIDGDPSDWESYEVLLADPAGDTARGGFDIAAVRAFTNDAFLYVLIETHNPATDFVQLDLDVRSGASSFVISFWPGADQEPYMGEVTTGEWEDIGEVESSSSALGEAVEVKMPLIYFEDTSDLELLNVRPMNGVCCESAWYAVDEIRSVLIAGLDELESEAGLMELPPSVCAGQITPPAPFGSLEPASITFTEPGFSAEWFVAPGAFNMPQEILLTPQGEMLVLSVRHHTLSRLDDDGTIASFVAGIDGYLGDVDKDGNIYLHFMPSGTISRISPNGAVATIVQSPLIQSMCDSGFGFGPDGNLYLAMTPCPDTPFLLKITPSGQITRVRDEIPELTVIRASPDGRLLAAGQSGVYEVSLTDYSLTKLNNDPFYNLSAGGMAIDDVGNVYIATGARESSGILYRMDKAGNLTEIAEIPQNGLAGIEWKRDTGEIVGGQLRRGGVLAIKPDGTIRKIVSGSGLVTPMGLAFSPCGELAVSNDEGGMATLVDPAGAVSWYMDYLTFIPPIPYLAFAPDGTLYASEAAPGLYPVRVAVRAPGDSRLRTLIDADYPSGLAYHADEDVLFVAESAARRILQINPDGSTVAFADGLDYPTALALDADGNLYAVVGTSQRTFDPIVDPAPIEGNAIIRISPQGEQTVVARIPDIGALAVGMDGSIYVTKGSEIDRVAPDGKISRFADGLSVARGLAFDLAGNLYVSDERLNAILRIGGFSQGTISGIVTDASGQPVANARAQVLSVNPIVVGQVVFTDEQGRFNLPAASGSYAVIISMPGYQEARQENIIMQAGQDTTLEVVLQADN